MENDLELLEDDRSDYRARSRFIALWIGLVMGILVALVGVRVLGQIVELKGVTNVQRGAFIAVDILLTGSVLAGGSEAFNKIMKVYNNVMNKTADKAKK